MSLKLFFYFYWSNQVVPIGMKVRLWVQANLTDQTKNKTSVEFFICIKTGIRIEKYCNAGVNCGNFVKPVNHIGGSRRPR